MSKAEKTKAFIIEKIAPVFNTKGYAGTSLSDMTEATGLTKGSIYGNFANKDEVALAVFDYNLNKANDIIKREMNRHTSAREKLLVYVSVYGNFLKQPFTSGGCPILNTATEADDTHPQLRKKAAAALHSWKNHIITIIETGITHKEFKPGTNAEQVALTIIAMVEGSIMIAKLAGKASYQQAVMHSLEQMINAL